MMEITREMAIGKIHRAVVTGADLHYVGSITVDEDLLDAANIVPGQKVDIVDVNNGERLSTYTIAGERGSGTIQLNGAAAHKVTVGDLVIIMAYAQVPESLVRRVKPSVVFVDGSNRILRALLFLCPSCTIDRRVAHAVHNCPYLVFPRRCRARHTYPRRTERKEGRA